MGAMVPILIVQEAILHPTIIHQATVSLIQSMSKWCGDQSKSVATNRFMPCPQYGLILKLVVVLLLKKEKSCLVIIIIFLCTFPLLWQKTIFSSQQTKNKILTIPSSKVMIYKMALYEFIQKIAHFGQKMGFFNHLI